MHLHGLQHFRLSCPSPSPKLCSDSRALNRWCLSNHFILCRPLLLLPSISPSIRVFSKELVLCIRWPKYWSFIFSISPSNEHPGLISLRIDWLDIPAVQGPLKSLVQHHSSKASILWHSAYFMVHLSHPYMTTGKTIVLTIWTYVGKVMSLLFNNEKVLSSIKKVGMLISCDCCNQWPHVGGLRPQKLVLPQFSSPEFLSQGVSRLGSFQTIRKHLLHVSLLDSGGGWQPLASLVCRHVTDFCLCLHMAISLCVCLCVSWRHQTLGCKPTQIQCDLVLTRYIFRDPVAKSSHYETPGFGKDGFKEDSLQPRAVGYTFLSLWFWTRECLSWAPFVWRI